MSELSLTFSGPWANQEAAHVVKGVDYLAVLDNALDVVCSTWTNLASGSVSLRNSLDTQVVSGSVVVSGDGEQTVRVELPQAVLSELGTGNHRMRLIATLAGREYLLHTFWLWVRD